MKSIDNFDAAIARAKHLLRFYELLQDTRSYSVRSDWAAKFKLLMHWPSSEKIVRVDGRDQQSILVFRESAGSTANTSRMNICQSFSVALWLPRFPHLIGISTI